MNIKRILAGTLAALTAGATMLFAAAASPASLGDYVVTDTNKITSPLIVIGSSAADATAYPKDVAAAADIAAALAGYATKPVPGAALSFTVSGGALVATRAQNLYLMQPFSEVKETFTERDLPTLLASGEVKNVKYYQYLSLDDQKVDFNDNPEDVTQPVLNVLFDTGETAYTYEIVFPSGLNASEVAGQSINLLGIDFEFSPRPSDLSNESIVLYRGGTSEKTISTGENFTFTVEGETHTITLYSVLEPEQEAGYTITCADLAIDGSSPEKYCEGDLIDVAGTKVWLRRVSAVHGGGMGYDYAVLSAGADKWTLKAGEGVYRGEATTPIEGTEDISFTASGDLIYKITIPYKVQDETYLLEGDSFVDPVFEAFKITYGGITPALDDESFKDKITVEPDGDMVVLTFTNQDGAKTSKAPIAWCNTSSEKFELTDEDENAIITVACNNTATCNITEGEYFIVRKGDVTYILQYTDTDKTNNVSKLKNLATGEIIDASNVTGKFWVGGYEFEFTLLNSTAGIITVDNYAGKLGDVIDLVTEQGATITLPNSSSWTNSKYLIVNITAVSYTHLTLPTN